ncbi:DUF5789 family protein [Halovenus marina]|uniref:DUF5789 family protein n=1 Tax=Halovenus marina TaxID=3396621 RepID=UPI003F5779C3
MTREVTLNASSAVFEELDYPIDRDVAAEQLADVTLQLADGEANLGGLIADSTTETFESSEALEAELHNVLPREAVGEPYQSEGEG